jgi:hypothetical protein
MADCHDYHEEECFFHFAFFNTLYTIGYIGFTIEIKTMQGKVMKKSNVFSIAAYVHYMGTPLSGLRKPIFA